MTFAPISGQCPVCHSNTFVAGGDTLRNHQTLIDNANLISENLSLKAELAEQCRIIGMSGEREARLLAQVEELERENERMENLLALDVHTCGPDCKRSGCVNRRLREENEALRKDAERLKFVTEGSWFVRWKIKPGKQKRYQMINDGDPEGKWYSTAREAIDAAMKGGE